MPWLVGIDEAGYGPNLGPLVMCSVSCRVPDSLAEADLWRVLRGAVRRQISQDARRLLIQDSKIVYSTARGLGELELGVLAGLSPWRARECVPLTRFLEWLCPGHETALEQEPWFHGTTELPVTLPLDELAGSVQRFDRCCRSNEVIWGPVCSSLVCARRFNELVERWNSKGVVLGEALGMLLSRNLEEIPGDEAVFFFIDKHGGRNCYAAVLQAAHASAMVIVREEGASRSCYELLGLGRPVTVRIAPRADGTFLNVALASMVSKYLRELLMMEFNQFWQSHVPDLAPTAGYPGDATRFFDAIEPTVKRMGIPLASIWRQR